MAEHQLPAYLQNRQVQDFTDYAADGLGSALPPHVSIRGNAFTLVDAGGQEYAPMASMDAVIVDRSNFACKMYYDKPWVPGAEDPPVCWSTNGVGPSRDATVPQARTCAECPNNVRGSAISKISGAQIKACRDEYHMAIMLPALPDMMFRYVLTPGSFDNWQNYTAKFKDSNVRICMVVTRMGFQPKVNGVVTFESTAYVDATINARVEQALLSKTTDALVGRNDVPRAISAPAAQVQIPPPNTTGQAPLLAVQPGSTMQVQQAAPFVPAASAIAQPLVATGFVPPAASPSEPPVPGRRRRRTAAEIQAAQPAGVQAPQSTPQVPSGQSPQAPFPVSQAPRALPGQLEAFAPQPGAQQPQFGMAPGTPIAEDPALKSILDGFFKPD